MQEIHTDILIIGGGLTGLTLANYLKKHSIKVTIVEARSRLGGRILTKKMENSAPLEMGATWIQPQHFLTVQLLKELGVKTFDQYLGKTAIYEAVPGNPHHLVNLPSSELPSLRICGGSHQMINALASGLNENQIHLGQEINSISQGENKLSASSIKNKYNASYIISTLPPALFNKHITTDPKLPTSLVQIAKSTHTWMGESIKISLTFKNKFWQEDELTGTIFSSIGPITEMYDHSNFENTHYALKGFINNFNYDKTKSVRLELILTQLEKYYGSQVRDFLHYEELVWRKEKYSYAESKEHLIPHQNSGHPLYQNSYLENRLMLAGTETSALHAGYMEGAIQSAKHVYFKLKENFQLEKS